MKLGALTLGRILCEVGSFFFFGGGVGGFCGGFKCKRNKQNDKTQVTNEQTNKNKTLKDYAISLHKSIFHILITLLIQCIKLNFPCICNARWVCICLT